MMYIYKRRCCEHWYIHIYLYFQFWCYEQFYFTFLVCFVCTFSNVYILRYFFFRGRTHSHGSVTVRYRKDAKLYIIHDWDITAPNCKCSVEDGYFLHPLCQMENQKASVINIKICDNGKQLSHVYDFHRT